MSVAGAPASGRHLMLFIAGDERNSRVARSNLSRLLPAGIEHDHRVEIVDVFSDLSLALEHHVLVTPALLQLHPEPRILVVGNLSDLDKVRTTLGLPGEERP